MKPTKRIKTAKRLKTKSKTKQSKAKQKRKGTSTILAEKLNEYNQKRNFAKTLEPEGKTEASDEGLIFVVQHHIARRDHYDLRLEWNGVLLSWAVPKGPSYNTQDKRLAVQVEDHPLEYRNFEGTIPKGEYGGGVVMLWDEGTWEPYGNVEEGLREGGLKFVLNGRRLRGKWALIRLKAKAKETKDPKESKDPEETKDPKDNWLLIKEKDDYAKTDTGISAFTTSIRTGRTMEEIESGEKEKITNNPFNTTDVQLAKLVNAVPTGDEWLYELKYDGYRIIAFVENNSVRLITRNGNDYTKQFNAIVTPIINLAAGRAMVLDGEMTVTDASGKTDFQALQSYIKNNRSQSLTYIVFDLLALDGVDLREHCLIDRKEMLEALMMDAPKGLHYSRHIKGNGTESFIAACEAGMEGIVGKKYDSIYSGTRNGDWIKLKCDKRQEFIIGGYTLSNKKASGISSILLGAYDGEKLVYVGRAGTGFNKRNMKELEHKFKSLNRDESPFNLPPKQRSNETITWLEPELIAEIKYAEWTEEHMLRQASFKGLVEDKKPKDIKMSNGITVRKKIEVDKKVKQRSTANEIENSITVNSKSSSNIVSKSNNNSDYIRNNNNNNNNNNKNNRSGNSTCSSNIDTNTNSNNNDSDIYSKRNIKKGSTGNSSINSNGNTNKSNNNTSTTATSNIINDSNKITNKKSSSNSVTIGGIKITNPDKVMFDDLEITKEDVIRYYEKVFERMLPYVSNRILSLVRCPKGISQTCFYKKHPGPESKGVLTIPVITSSGETEEYFYIKDSSGLIYEAQMGTLEFHTWGSRIEELEKPDIMVFDLDPDEGMELSRVRQGVQDIKDLLAELSLNSYLKTSGGKGYHVVVPLKPSVSWDVFYDFAKRVAEVMEQKWPDLYTSNVRKAKRSDKIFIDWIRNGRGATSVAPYSLRARKGAKVSMPIEWDELNTIAPDGVNMSDALLRINGKNPWKDFFQNNQMLK